MVSDTPTPTELHDLLVRLLTDVVGGTEARWRKLVTVERVSLSLSPASSWKVVPAGTPAQREAIEHAVAIVRAERPYVVW